MLRSPALGSRAFLRRHGAPALRRPGQIVHIDGRRLGEHEGQDAFTVGQRRGLGVADGEPLYVRLEGRARPPP